MQFEWNETKRRRNIEKHGLDFADAIALFVDPGAIVSTDSRRDYHEVRLRAIGRVGDIVIAVVLTERLDRLRMISARRASRRERQRYDSPDV